MGNTKLARRNRRIGDEMTTVPMQLADYNGLIVVAAIVIALFLAGYWDKILSKRKENKSQEV